MSKVKLISLAASLAFATALAQPDGFDEDDEKFYHKTSAQPSITSSMNSSVGYYRIVLNDLEDYSFNGAGFAVGGSSLIFITDIVQFGFLASIGYYSVFTSNTRLSLSRFYLDVEPKFRLGREETYADIFLNIDIPLLTEATIKIPGDDLNFDVKDTEAIFAVGFFWRYDFFGAGIGKALTGSKNTTIMAAFFLPQKRFEVIPSISYGTGKDGINLNVSFGTKYTF
jgi:hypothetical protein